MRYLKWYYVLVEREHPHRGCTVEEKVFRPGTPVTDLRWFRFNGEHGVWGTLGYNRLSFRADELIDHWPPREDE